MWRETIGDRTFKRENPCVGPSCVAADRMTIPYGEGTARMDHRCCPGNAAVGRGTKRTTEGGTCCSSARLESGSGRTELHGLSIVAVSGKRIHAFRSAVNGRGGRKQKYIFFTNLPQPHSAEAGEPCLAERRTAPGPGRRLWVPREWFPVGNTNTEPVKNA